MENETYQIVKYRPEFKSKLVNLQAHLWGQDQAVRAAYFDWKYNWNPYVDGIYIYLAFCNEKLVGMVGAYGVQWEIGDAGQSWPALCFADLIIIPDHRHGNLLQNLMSFALEDLSDTDYAYVFDLSAAPQLTLVLLMQGWRRVFIQTAQRETHQATTSGQGQKNEKRRSWIASVYRQSRRYSRRVPMLASTYHRLRGLFSRCADEPRSTFADLDRNAGQREANPYISLSKTSRPRAKAELVERIGTDGRIRHVRDEQYFSWRFQNPLSEYRFLFWDDGRFDGYLALQSKCACEADGWAYIVDWEATNGRVWTDLLQAVIQLGNFDGLYIWSETLSGDAKEWLREAGFYFLNKTGKVRNDSQGENIFVKAICPASPQSRWVLNNQDLLDARNWDLRMIYSDAY